MALWATYVITAAAMITAAAATAGAAYAREVRNEVRANSRRSKQNYRLLTGRDPESGESVSHIDGAYPRLRQLEGER